MKDGKRIQLVDTNPHQLSEFFEDSRCISVTLQSRGTNTGTIEFGPSRAGMVTELKTLNGIGQSSIAPVKSLEAIWFRATVPNDEVNVNIW